MAFEALRFARSGKNVSNPEILRFARLVRQDTVVRLCLEALE